MQRLIPGIFFVALLLQFIYPAIALMRTPLEGAQRFAWQMFSRPAKTKDVIVVSASGLSENIDPTNLTHPVFRGDMVLGESFAKFLCAKREAATRVEVVSSSGERKIFSCDAGLKDSCSR